MNIPALVVSKLNHGAPMSQDAALAASITRSASRQTDFTIRHLTDRDRVGEAYQAYAYFRWVDDALDATLRSQSERDAFIQRQESLLARCYRAEAISLQSLVPEERMLVTLVGSDAQPESGLSIYLKNMMAVMRFDANRRGQLISSAELNQYTFWLASAVTEALHYFIGHGGSSPHDQSRYLAVTAAHVTHMLRDTFDDLRAGYFNIPTEVLEAGHIAPEDVTSDAYRAWVKSRVSLARNYFHAGRAYLNQVESQRCRLAGYAYTARFECLLDTIEHEGFYLRPSYDERRRWDTGLRMGWKTLVSLLKIPEKASLRQSLPMHSQSHARARAHSE